MFSGAYEIMIKEIGRPVWGTLQLIWYKNPLQNKLTYLT